MSDDDTKADVTLEATVSERIEIDHIVTVCSGCSIERRFDFEPPLVGADKLVEWMRNDVAAVRVRV